ncbi:MAG: hypothetical protein WBV69_07915 [Candidatus Sulfotelmatobacter sp.]
MQSPSLTKLMWFTESVLVLFILISFVSAQTSDNQAPESKSWTTITESHTADANPTRTTESHRESGKDSVDTQNVERLGPDGHFEPYFDVEKETIQVNDTTIRTVERTFARDESGHKILKQVTEEEKQSLPAGQENVVRTTSNADLDGHLQVMQREVADTRRISPDLQEKKTTVFLSDGEGGMAPSIQTRQSEKRTGDQVEVQESTLVLDGAGNWQVHEQKVSTIEKEGKERTTEEQLWREGADGKLAVVSRTLGKDSETAAGEKRQTAETYSANIIGSAPDGNLHLSRRVTLVKQKPVDRAQITEQLLEQLNPGDPAAGLQVTTKTLDIVQPDPAGTQETRTIEVQNASGSFDVVSVDTQRSDNIHARDVAITPQNKP